MMRKAMYQACADVLALATRIPTAVELPAPATLHQKIAALFEAMMERGEALRIPDDDIAEARYALAAFLDEQLLRSRWSGRDTWVSQPLQLVYFNENTAGEGFFVRMEALARSPARSHVLYIYYLCVALGFRGRYAVGGVEGLQEILATTRARLLAETPLGATLSPRGAAPDRGPLREGPPRRAVVAGAAALGIALVVVTAFKIDLEVRAGRVTRELDAARYIPSGAR